MTSYIGPTTYVQLLKLLAPSALAIESDAIQSSVTSGAAQRKRFLHSK